MAHIRALLAVRPTLARYDLEGAFRHAGFAVELADGGHQCLTAARRVQPEVVVLDAELPWGGADGVLEIMAEDPQLSGIPCLLLALNADAATTFRLARFRIDDLVTRPVSALQLAWRAQRLAARQAAHSLDLPPPTAGVLPLSS